jgi:hypothetical protein
MLLLFAGLVSGLAVLAFVAWMHAAEPRGQHAAAGEGALTVDQLRARVERERELLESMGRHALRDVAILTVAV